MSAAALLVKRLRTEGRLMAEAADIIDWLTAQRVSQLEYSIDLQRIIEDLCANREISLPVSTARHHYNMAVAARAKMEPKP
jgi:hypothetical protein